MMLERYPSTHSAGILCKDLSINCDASGRLLLQEPALELHDREDNR